jgi:hypothetical protein
MLLTLAARGRSKKGNSLWSLPPRREESRRTDVTKRPVILCVDDEWNGLEGHRMLFEERYKVLVATSGDEPLQLFRLSPN